MAGLSNAVKVLFLSLALASAISLKAAAAGATPADAAAKAQPHSKKRVQATRHRKKTADKPATEGKNAKATTPKASGPNLVGTYGDWSAFTALEGKDRTCYALSQPKQRLPDGLKRDPAYIFIASRPAKNVKNETSIIMGFTMKDGTPVKADFGAASFDFVGTGTTAWLKNPAQGDEFIAALRKRAKLTVAAASIKSHVTTDTYALAGLVQALEKVAKECN